MGAKSVKIQVAGRTYPLTVEDHEESFVNDAAKRINDRVAQLEARYAVRDKQDLLAMAALQFATMYLESQNKSASQEQQLAQDLLYLNQLLDQGISASFN
jgi:cell division protein ZapA (FtsZ GTPase activity inhibitor)